MKILIVDDEAPGRQRLRRLLQDISPQADVVEAANGEEALRTMRHTPADLALLDIRLPGMDGLELAEALSQWRPAPALVFTTAFDQHALRAFDSHAIAYLLKPIAKDKLADALRGAAILNRAQIDRLRVDSGAHRGHISGRRGDDLIRTPVGGIRYFKTRGKYVEAVWPDGSLLVDEPLADLEKEFSSLFARAHRNALVALRHVRTMEKTDTGWEVCFTGVKETLPVSRRLVGVLRKRLKQKA